MTVNIPETADTVISKTTGVHTARTSRKHVQITRRNYETFNNMC